MSVVQGLVADTSVDDPRRSRDLRIRHGAYSQRRAGQQRRDQQIPAMRRFHGSSVCREWGMLHSDQLPRSRAINECTVTDLYTPTPLVVKYTCDWIVC